MHYSMLGRRDDMVGTLQQIKAHANEFDQAYLVVGDFYLRMGDGETAIREYREGMAQGRQAQDHYQKRIIEVLMRQGKRAEAADLNAEILKADPNDNDAKGLAASFLLDKGDVARAMAELQALVTRVPENPVARYNLGRAHVARGEWEQARQMFQKAIELRPDYIVARLELGQLQIARGEFDAALKTAEQVLQFDRGQRDRAAYGIDGADGAEEIRRIARDARRNLLRHTRTLPTCTSRWGWSTWRRTNFKDAPRHSRSRTS